MSQIRSFEVGAAVGVALLMVCLVVWVLVSYQRRPVQPERLGVADRDLLVDDWRIMVPPEWRTDETQRLYREMQDDYS